MQIEKVKSIFKKTGVGENKYIFAYASLLTNHHQDEMPIDLEQRDWDQLKVFLLKQYLIVPAKATIPKDQEFLSEYLHVKYVTTKSNKADIFVSIPSKNQFSPVLRLALQIA